MEALGFEKKSRSLGVLELQRSCHHCPADQKFTEPRMLRCLVRSQPTRVKHTLDMPPCQDLDSKELGRRGPSWDGPDTSCSGQARACSCGHVSFHVNCPGHGRQPSGFCSVGLRETTV